MLQRKYIFPHVIEMNYQAGHRLGVNVYLIDGGSEFLLIDVGFLDAIDEIVELIRQMDFELSTCKMIIATHADADHVQGVARAKELLKTKVAAHPLSVEPLESGDEITTYATIKAQGIEIPMPRCKMDTLLNEGDVIEVGECKLEVWHSPGHTPGHLAFKMGNLLFSGDNIYRDRLRRRHRCPSRLEPARLHRLAAADHQGTIRSSCCPATGRSSADDNASSRRRSIGSRVPVPGRFRHLCCRGRCSTSGTRNSPRASGNSEGPASLETGRLTDSTSLTDGMLG